MKKVKEALWSLDTPSIWIKEIAEREGEEGVIRFFLDRLRPEEVLRDCGIIREKAFSALLWILDEYLQNSECSVSSSVMYDALKKLTALVRRPVDSEMIREWRDRNATLEEVRFATPA